MCDCVCGDSWWPVPELAGRLLNAWCSNLKVNACTGIFVRIYKSRGTLAPVGHQKNSVLYIVDVYSQHRGKTPHT